MKAKRIASAAVGLAAAVLTLAGCSHIQPSVGQYAIVTGHGGLSSTRVQQVVAPGDNVHVGSGTTTWYVPANVRNYVTGLPGTPADRSNPQAELTGTSKSSPGMSVYTYTYVGWELNPRLLTSKTFAQSFLDFCLKYGCGSTSPQNDASNESLSHSSTPGWNTMLAEIFPHAVDNATQTAIQGFGPDLWTSRAEWTQLGSQIASTLPGEISKMTGTAAPFFCGPGSTPARCAPFTVIVNQVKPEDPGVVSAYNQQVSAAYQSQAGASRLNAAKLVYGSDANWFLGMADLIGDCHAQHVTCNMYVGNAPTHP